MTIKVEEVTGAEGGEDTVPVTFLEIKAEP
jgi:hypothetical protein